MARTLLSRDTRQSRDKHRAGKTISDQDGALMTSDKIVIDTHYQQYNKYQQYTYSI